MPYWGDEELEVYVEEGATPTYVRSTRRAFIGESEPELNNGDIWFDPSESVSAVRAAGDVTFFDSGLTVITGVSNVQAALAAVDEALAGPMSTATVATTQSTSSTTFTDLATVGPEVTHVIPSTGSVKVTLTALLITPDVTFTDAAMSIALSGANTAAAGTYPALRAGSRGLATGVFMDASRAFLITGLTPGSTTFTCKYKMSTANAGNFSARNILVEDVHAAVA